MYKLSIFTTCLVLGIGSVATPAFSQERGERGERARPAERAERPQRGERAERPAREGAADRAQRPERPAREGAGDRAQRPERPAREGAGDRAQRPERAERPARGAEGAADRARPDRSAAMLETMKTELGLNDAQVTRIQALQERNTQARERWQESTAERRRAINEEMAAARRARDTEAMTAAREKMQALNQQQTAMATEHREAVMAVLTPAQRARWEAYGLSNGIIRSLGRVQPALTDAQQEQIRKLAADLVANPPAAEGETPVAPRQVLMTQVTEKVLTEEQRASLQRAAGPRARPGGEDAGPQTRPAPRENRPEAQPRRPRANPEEDRAALEL